MISSTRRAFLFDLGCGALAAAAAPAMLGRLEPPRSRRGFGDRITFGRLEPLASLMQECEPDDLLPKVVKKLNEGVPLRDLVAAAALANARTCGGEDYTGYHCAMALMPAFQMAGQTADPKRAPLPVLKVLYRNTTRLQELGGASKEKLTTVEAATSGGDAASLLDAERRRDVDLAERLFATTAAQGDAAAYEVLQALVRENMDVHQVVLAWRSWDLLELTGREHAHVMLRQSLRHCVDRERGRVKNGAPPPAIRELLPKLLEEYGLERQRAKTVALDDDAVQKLARSLFVGREEDAARAVALALANGADAEAVGEAISLASVCLLLHDRGGRGGNAKKPAGSVHGASVGVHASDSAGAWRGIARVASHRTRMASLVAGAWHTAGQSGGMDVNAPFHAPDRERAQAIAPGDLLTSLEGFIRERAQGPAAAVVERYGALDRPPEPLVQVLLEHATTHDGALHNEKFFRTAFESFQTSRPKFRWLHLAALARVCASSYGFEAPGLAEARRLLLA